MRHAIRLTIALTLLLAQGESSAAGLATHLEIAQRALDAYAADPSAPGRELVLAYPDAFQAGAVFPDWGFSPAMEASSKPDVNGNINSDAAEAAHWTPFLKAAAAYLRARPTPWDEHTNRLAAFFLGAMAHGLADTSWHSQHCTATPMGLLQSMANIDFTKDYESPHGINGTMPAPPPNPRSAHVIGDTCGDPLITYRAPMTWISEKLWYPVDDLVAIYAAFNPKLGVSADQLRAAIKQQLVYTMFFRTAENGRTVRSIIENNYYPYAALWSPFLIERIDGYYLGGLDSSAGWISLRWPLLFSWFSREPEPGTFMTDAALYCPEQDTSSGQLGPHHAFELPTAERALPGQKQTSVRTRAVAGGQQYQLPGAGVSASARAGEGLSSPYAQAGSDLTVSRGRGAGGHGDFNHDGVPDLVIGAPGVSVPGKPYAGAVYIRYGTAGVVREPARVVAADLTRSGTEALGRFGGSVAVVDFNADGYDDLAVGVPSSGAATLSYRGRVLVFLGREGAAGLSDTPDFTLEAGDVREYGNFGSVLKGADCNGDGFDDLIVGSPYAGPSDTKRQSGAVHVFLAARRNPGESVTPAWSAWGGNFGDEFGSALVVARIAGNAATLVIGAPSVKVGNQENVGRVYGYSLEGIGGARIVNPEPVFTVTGNERSARMGAALAVGTPVDDSMMLAIGLPTAGEDSRLQAGRVLVTPLAALRGEMSIDQLTPRVRINGEQRFARVGFALVLRDVDGDQRDDLVIGEPMRVESVGVDTGRVYVWRGGASFPAGTVETKSATSTATLPRHRGQFGRVLDVLSANALAVAAPHAHDDGRFAGAVYTVPALLATERAAPRGATRRAK